MLQTTDDAARPGRRGVIAIRADADPLAGLAAKIDGIAAKIEEDRKAAVKISDIAEIRAENVAFKAGIESLSKELTAIKLNPYGTAARSKHVPLNYIKGDQAQDRAHKVGQIWFAMRGVKKSQDWCRENGVYAAMSEGVNTAGGFLVPTEFMNEIIVLLNQYGIARRLCRVVPMGRDTMSVPKLGSGLTMYFTGEGIAGTQSQLLLSQVNLSVKKGMVLTGISSELSEDSAISIADLLVSEMARAIRTGEDGCMFSGDGTSTYGGMTGLRTIFNAGAGVLAGAVDAASAHDTMAEIDAADLARAMGALPQYVYETGNPVWICSQTMWANVFERLIGASGGVTKDQASGRTVREYNGYPVEITPAMLSPAAPTTDTSDVAMILFGDPRLSVIFGDRREMRVESSSDWKFDQDQIYFKTTTRFDIVAHGTGDATTPGAIVALMGE